MATEKQSPSYTYEAGRRCFHEGKTLVDNPHFPYGWWDAFWAGRKTENLDGD